MPSSKQKKVSFVINALPHYREEFFELLRDKLLSENILLEVIYGSNQKGHNIAGNVPWAIGQKISKIGPFLWLPVLHKTRNADLVVLPQVLKHLHIYPIILRRAFSKQKIALWGHGKVFSALPEKKTLTYIKKIFSRQCDWWFAYTERTARIVRNEIGFPADRISVVNNAVDTKKLATARDLLSNTEIETLRAQLGILSTNVGIFVGGMYHVKHHTKRLPFLVQACIAIRRKLPDFEMIFIGGGPEQGIVEKAAIQHKWIHYYGVKKGLEAVPYWALAKICLNPGLVGLGILDSLALGVPMVTSNVSYHSPEIEYLMPGINGIIVNDDDDPEIFARSAISLLQDETTRTSLSEAGKVHVRNFTNEGMVENFVSGILRALRSPGHISNRALS